MRNKWLVAALVLAGASAPVRAEVKNKTISYEYGGVTFKGYLAWDDAAKGKRPGVLVVHEWWGLNDYARQRARQLAGLGYVAFACPERTCQELSAALETAKVDYEFIYYGGAVHSFTVAGSEKVGRAGMAYNAAADRRSWRAMLDLFHEAFGE